MKDIYIIGNHMVGEDGEYHIKCKLLLQPSISDVFTLKIKGKKDIENNKYVYKEYKGVKKEMYQTEEIELLYDFSLFLKQDHYLLTIETEEESLFLCEVEDFFLTVVYNTL